MKPQSPNDVHRTQLQEAYLQYAKEKTASKNKLFSINNAIPIKNKRTLMDIAPLQKSMNLQVEGRIDINSAESMMNSSLYLDESYRKEWTQV